MRTSNRTDVSTVDGLSVSRGGGVDVSNSSASTGGAAYPYGVTPPVSEKYPTPRDEELTAQLSDVLQHHNLYETPEAYRRRENVLRQLNQLLVEWIYEVGLEQGLPEEEARAAGGHIFTFGSYRLGLVSPGSDIDTLCVAPSHISRASFFSLFYAKLQQDPNVTGLRSVPDAYTPIIKLFYEGVDIDLLFASLQMRSIPKDLTTLTDDQILKNVDDVTARCLNGCRVADMILQLVPNKETFRTTLLFIKHWAKRRGIYSNVLGYLGGVSWALLTARVCQLYPNYVASQVVERFFRIFEKWNWKNPIVLCKIKGPKSIPGLMEFKVWNPKTNMQDQQHLMPIITPAFPSMNSTHNVTHTTMNVMTEEFRRGHELVRKVQMNLAAWGDVLEPLGIFHHAHHFLQLQILAQSEMTHQKWKGWVESKVRFFLKELEQLKDVKVRPWPTVYVFQSEEWEFASSMFLALYFTYSHNGSAVLPGFREAISNFVKLIETWPEKEKFSSEARLQVQYLRFDQLPAYVFDKEKAVTKPTGGNTAPLLPPSPNKSSRNRVTDKRAHEDASNSDAPNGRLVVPSTANSLEASSVDKRPRHGVYRPIRASAAVASLLTPGASVTTHHSDSKEMAASSSRPSVKLGTHVNPISEEPSGLSKQTGITTTPNLRKGGIPIKIHGPSQ